METTISTKPSIKKAETQSMLPFFVVWTGQAFSLIGSSLVGFALVWWLTQSTGSASVLALAMSMSLLPQIFLGPFAGALVDRWNRRIVMMVADGTSAMATLVLALLFALGNVQIWMVYVLMFVRACAGAFHWPAMQASTSLMVPEKHLSRIAGLNQALSGIGNIAAPPLGALLLAVLPMEGILSIDISTAALAIACLFFIAIPQPVRKAQEGSEQGPGVLADLVAGLRFVWRWSGLRSLILLALCVHLLFTPIFALLPILVTRYFNGGVGELAGIQSAWGIGLVAGGLLLSAWGGFKKRILTGMAGILLMGASLAFLGTVPARFFGLAVAAFFITGFSNPIINGSIFAIMQSVVPHDMQGRVLTLMLSLGQMTTPIGLAIAGPLSDRVGAQVWYLAAGVMILIAGTFGFFIPALMKIEENSLPA